MRRRYHLLIWIQYKLVLLGYLQYTTSLSLFPPIIPHDPLPFCIVSLIISLPPTCTFPSPFHSSTPFSSSPLSSETPINRAYIAVAAQFLHPPIKHADGQSVSLPNNVVFVHFYLRERHVYYWLPFFSFILLVETMPH